MRRKLGAWGKTIFWWRQSNGIEGDTLELQQRGGSVRLNAAEVAVVVAFAAAAGIEAAPVIRKSLVTRCRRAGMEVAQSEVEV